MSGFLIIALNCFLVLVISIILGIRDLSNPMYFDKKMDSEENEIKLDENVNSTNVLGRNGTLSLVGWSKSYKKLHFDPSRINPSSSYLSIFNNLRYKKWEGFIFIHKNFILGIGIFDISYLGGYVLHYADLKKEDTDIYYIEHMNPLHKPKITDECYSDCNAAKFNITNFHYLQKKGLGNDNQELKMMFNDSRIEINFDLKLMAKDSDSMVTLTPISEDTTLFYYNIKTYNIVSTGTIAVNGEKFNTDDMLIAYDTGRGVWPLRSGWIWISANGKTKNGELFGLNLGEGFSNPVSSRHTEDSFFINGKLFKLAPVDTNFIRTDNLDEFKKWEFKSQTTDKVKNKCSITFIPAKKKNHIQNLLLTKNLFNIIYGVFQGTCYDEKENVFELDNVFGIIEYKLSFW